MSSKRLIFIILLLMVAISGQAFAQAAMTVVPLNVPKGAYVNGPLGAADDNYYWQTVELTLNGIHPDGEAITITLPTDIDVADIDGDANFVEEISVSTDNAVVTGLAATGTTANQVVVVHTGALAANDVVTIMFPVVTSLTPGAAVEYLATFTTDAGDDQVAGEGVDITFVDPGPNAIAEVTFSTALMGAAGVYDSTLVDGEIYPAVGTASYTAGLADYLTDIDDGVAYGANGSQILGANLPALVLTSFTGAAAAIDTDDTYYTVYASQDSTLNHINGSDTGVILMNNHTVAAAPLDLVNAQHEGHTGAQGLTVANLPEGEWYFYVINSLTGDFPLGRSDKLTVMHWPQVDVLAWDYNASSTLENADTAAMTLDSGLFLAANGAVLGSPAATNTVDFYISVDDFDDDADVSLYYSSSSLTAADVTTSGVSPDLVVTGLTGATLIVSDLLENEEDVDGYITTTWTNTDLPAGDYYIYAVANDGKVQTVQTSKGFDDTNAPTYSGATTLQFHIKHSPALRIDALDEYDLGTDTNNDADVTIDPNQTDVIMLSWGKFAGVAGDNDIDDSSTIEFYIDAAGAANTVDFGSADAAALRLAAANSPSTTHQIITSLSEDLEGKSDSYYAWDLKADWLSQTTPWVPTAEATSSATGHYHLYGIITEGSGASDTERVVCLGINTVFAAGVSTPTEISFDMTDGYASLSDPPAGGTTIGPNDTYRVNFQAFDFDSNSETGIFIVEENANAEMLTNPDLEAGEIGWTVGGDWDVVGGQAVFTAGGGVTTFSQPFNTLANVQYTVEFDVIANANAGTMAVTLGGQAVVTVATTATGHYKATITGALSAAGLVFTPSVATIAATYDNFTVRAGNSNYTDGMMTTTIGDISGDNVPDGGSYTLTSTVGTLAGGAALWLSEDTDTYYDISLTAPGGAASKYTTGMNTTATALADGNYYVYIGSDPDNNDFADGTEKLYRAPGLLTIVGVAAANPQQNLSMEPRKFVSTVGDSATVSIRAYTPVAADVDIIDIYIAVEQDYFDLVDTDDPFVDANFATASLIANEAINDTTNSRWIIHATLANLGAEIQANTSGIGDELLTFQVVGKGTNNAIGETSAFTYLNEPANGYVTTFKNNGNTLAFNSTAVSVEIRPRGIIEGIVEFEGRATSREIVTFILRERGSYIPTTDATFIAANDGAQADSSSMMDAGLYSADAIQYRLDSDGKFTLYQVPTGDWELSVYYQRYLAKVQDLSISAGLDSLMVDFGILLGGDAVGYTDVNGDAYPNNSITQADVNRINAAYGSTPADTMWATSVDASTGGKYNFMWADINEDDVVNVNDLSMATGNFTGVANNGAQPVYKPTIDPSGSGESFVEFANTPTELKSGQTYTFQVVINDAVNVKGYDVRMDLDQSALSFVSIAKGDFVTASSNTFAINTGDTVGLVNTVYGPSAYSGNGVLAEVTFKALTDGVFTSDMLGISQATVVDNLYRSFELMSVDAPTGISTDIPVEFVLNQNFPNPFNPTTTVSFSIPRSSNVEINIYNVLGRHVTTLASGMYEPGNHSIVWDATDMSGNQVSNGMYFCTINAADFHSTSKMMFMK
ncbi:FlgD immunoglobulin-like domain containing protein [Candidatus Latescibacterota bacterium]